MNDLPRKQRRQRAILSCNDCRRRKLRCDRLDPCNRCIKGGIADSCAYGPEAHSCAPHESRERSVKRIKRRSARRPTSNVAESLHQSDSEHSVVESTEAHEPQSHVPELKDQAEFLANSPEPKGISHCSATVGMLTGRGYGTHFYGASSVMSVVAHFPDLRAYMRVAHADSTARRISQEMKASEDRARQQRIGHLVLTVCGLRSLLPDRSTVDSLLDTYFNTFETTFRIIHVPSFKSEYAGYWDSQAAEDTDMDAVILAILACTVCSSSYTSPRYNFTGSTFRSKAYKWIKACEAWLKRQSNKHRSLASLQVRCLRLLAYRTANIKVKEYYQEVQVHASFMRSAGMHIDPTVFGSRCTPFDGEMRRRLWATTMELELQASIDKGTSSLTCSLSYDCAPPRNVNDLDLNPDMQELPPSYSITTFTDSSYLNLSTQSIQIRSEVCRKVNDLQDSPDKIDAIQYDDAIQQHLSSLPRWSDPRSTQARTLLELQLRQLLTIVHAPRVLQVEPRRSSNCRYGMVAALEAAARTIDLHHSLASTGNYALLLTRDDYFRSALLICHVAYYARRANDTVMMRLAKLFLEDSMDKALFLQTERALRPGRGAKFLWYISAAVSLAATQFKPQDAEEYTRLAVDRIAKLLYRVMSLHDDPTEDTLATEILLEEQRVPVPTQIDLSLQTTADHPLTVDAFAEAGLGLDAFDYADTTGFMMDDLCFFNMPPMYVDEGLSYVGF